MTGQFYDNPETRVYHLDAVGLTTAGNLLNVVGPAGKVGRVRELVVILTVATTVADEGLVLDTLTPSLTTPVALTLPFTGSAIGDIIRVSAATLAAASELTADTVLQLANDGLSTACSGSLTLVIDWY